MKFLKLFGRAKSVVIGMVHVQALPGKDYWDAYVVFYSLFIFNFDFMLFRHTFWKHGLKLLRKHATNLSQCRNCKYKQGHKNSLLFDVTNTVAYVNHNIHPRGWLEMNCLLIFWTGWADHWEHAWHSIHILSWTRGVCLYDRGVCSCEGDLSVSASWSSDPVCSKQLSCCCCTGFRLI